MKAYTNVNLVTCDSVFHVYREGLLVVEDDRIAYCGPYDQAWLGKCSETVDYESAWIMPGLVNCHTHSAMTLLRGIVMTAICMNGWRTISGQQKVDSQQI